MPYVQDRTIHDADAHVMEVPGFLDDFVEARFRPALQEACLFERRKGFWESLPTLEREMDGTEWRAQDEAQIMLRKNWSALGAFRKQDRSRSLDLLGFASQLVFTTAMLRFTGMTETDLDAAYGLATAHNRYMVDFCAADRRLLAVGYVPLADFERARRATREAIDMGCKALMIPSRCPRTHSPSHIAIDPVWAQAQEAGLPIVLHVGGTGQLIDPAYFDNGLPPVPDFHGGDDNFKSIDYMAIGYQPMQTMSALVIDGVLDRFPQLRFGLIELGASWLPGWMRSMDAAHNAFYKNEERLQRMSLKPSEFVRRQVRVTPYPHEDTGWIIANSGDEVCLFSSDYPHVEGGRNPLKRFETSLDNARIGVAARQRFYCDNFIDLMGNGLAPDLRTVDRRAA